MQVELTTDELEVLTDALETFHDSLVSTLRDLPEADKVEHVAFTDTVADLAAKLAKLA